MANRAAGYISSQTCPINPEHGVALRTDRGYYCPHAEHDKPGAHTPNSWTLDEWEAIKSDEPLPPPSEPTTTQPDRAPNRRARKAKPRAKRTR
jgi:hypothetical protein